MLYQEIKFLFLLRVRTIVPIFAPVVGHMTDYPFAKIGILRLSRKGNDKKVTSKKIKL